MDLGTKVLDSSEVADGGDELVGDHPSSLPARVQVDLCFLELVTVFLGRDSSLVGTLGDVRGDFLEYFRYLRKFR